MRKQWWALGVVALLLGSAYIIVFSLHPQVSSLEPDSASTFCVASKKGKVVRWSFIGLAMLGGVLVACSTSVGEWRAVPLLFVAGAVLTLQAKSTGHTQLVGILGGLLAWVGAVVNMTATDPFDLFYKSRVEQMGWSQVVVGALVVVVAGLGCWAARAKAEPFEQEIVAFLAVTLGIYGVVTMIVVAFGQSPALFFLGHLVVSVTLAAIAAAVLLAGLRNTEHLTAAMAWGLTLVATALFKLFIFDLAYMDLIVKAFTFLAVGVVLLAAGAKYAMVYAAARREQSGGAASGPQPEMPQGPSWGGPGVQGAPGAPGMGGPTIGGAFGNPQFGPVGHAGAATEDMSSGFAGTYEQTVAPAAGSNPQVPDARPADRWAFPPAPGNPGQRGSERG